MHFHICGFLHSSVFPTPILCNVWPGLQRFVSPVKRKPNHHTVSSFRIIIYMSCKNKQHLQYHALKNYSKNSQSLRARRNSDGESSAKMIFNLTMAPIDILWPFLQYTKIPYRMKLYTEFNLASGLRFNSNSQK